MALVSILDHNGDKFSQIELSDFIFDVTINKSILHQVVVAQLNNKRSGTLGVKRRSEVKGSGRKLYRQKGTGRARKGDIKSPLLRGGGVVFGPIAKTYNKKVLKKVARAALKMALTTKLRDKQFFVFKDFGLIEIKTKFFVKFLSNFKIESCLIITDGDDKIVRYSSRNIPRVKVLSFRGLNVLDILKYTNLIILESSLKGIEGRLL